MWIYNYGLYDPEFIKEEAKSWVIMMLNRAAWGTPPTHTNPLVQALIEELLQ